MKYILALLVLFPTLTSAFNTEDILHPVAHGGGSYALTHVGSVLCHKASQLSTLQCSLIGAGSALLLGLAVELTQDQTKRNAAKGIAYDALGAGIAVGIINWDF